MHNSCHRKLSSSYQLIYINSKTMKTILSMVMRYLSLFQLSKLFYAFAKNLNKTHHVYQRTMCIKQEIQISYTPIKGELILTLV